MSRPIVLIALLVLLAAPVAAQTTVEVFLHEPLHIAPAALNYILGETVRLVISNPAANNASHDLKIDGYYGMPFLLQPGEAATPTLAFDKAGVFDFYCTVPGHRAGGMRGVLTVHDNGSGSNDTPAPAALAGLALLAGGVLLRRRRA